MVKPAPKTGPRRTKVGRWSPLLYTKARHTAARSATKSEIEAFVDRIRTNSPEFLEGLGDPAWQADALLTPIIARSESNKLIEFEEGMLAFGSLLELSQLAPHHLLNLIEEALKKRAETQPDWLYGPQGKYARKREQEKEKSWGPGTTVNQPAGDIPPQDDPRFGTW